MISRACGNPDINNLGRASHRNNHDRRTICDQQFSQQPSSFDKKNWNQLNAFKPTPLIAYAAVRSKAVVLLL